MRKFTAAITFLLGLWSAVPGWAAPTAAAEPGVWQKHEYSFVFMGFTTTYSCDGLAGKLKTLLLAAGARPDVQSRPAACGAGFGRPDKFARAELTFYTLSPAASATAIDPAAIDPADKPVDGTWQSVTLSRHLPRELSTGDCELVEQFRANLLPMFTARNIDNRTTCVPHQDSGSVIDLKFDAFGALPKAR